MAEGRKHCPSTVKIQGNFCTKIKAEKRPKILRFSTGKKTENPSAKFPHFLAGFYPENNPYFRG